MQWSTESSFQFTERVVEFSHVERLSEMFPLAEKNFISYALEITETFEEAVDLLMDSKENHLDQSEVSWKRLFLMCKNKTKIDGKERLSIVDRTKLFKECLTFYKTAVAYKSMLRKEFTVEFSQELGIDAGAVKVEMFMSFFKQVLREMFELVDGFGYMPRKSGSTLLFKLLGFSIAHSFLQNGPPFPNLTNWISEALVQSNEDVVCSQLSVNYIPLNAVIPILKLFKKKVDDANTNEELDSLFIRGRCSF